MEVSQRLQRVAKHVPEGAILADIGTDHGFLPIWLVKQGRIRKAFACDVRSGPLSRAEKHIKEEGLQAKIYTRLSDGFAALRQENITAAVIAGMGGRLTAQILYEEFAREHTVLEGLTDLIVQPQSEWDIARKALHDCGFCIIDEEMVEEKEQYYLIIHSQPGQETYNAGEYSWGRYLKKKKDPVFRRYLEREDKKNQNLQAILASESETDSVRIRLQELEEESRKIREVQKQWR